jgi:hypothetical protein
MTKAEVAKVLATHTDEELRNGLLTLEMEDYEDSHREAVDDVRAALEGSGQPILPLPKEREPILDDICSVTCADELNEEGLRIALRNAFPNLS